MPRKLIYGNQPYIVIASPYQPPPTHPLTETLYITTYAGGELNALTTLFSYSIGLETEQLQNVKAGALASFC